MAAPDIRGIIFDMDGVIADTVEMHYQSWQQLADEEGIPFDRQKNEALRGKTRDVSLDIFIGDRTLDDETRQAWLERKNSYFHQRMRQMTPADTMPGINALIEQAKARAYKIAVGSSSRNAKPVLTQLGLIAQFDAIGDGTIPSNSKPAPDIFLWTAGAIGIPPRNLLVIEDSAAGIQAGLTGGFYVVGVGEAATDDAHGTFDTLADVSLQTLLNCLPQN